LFARQVRDQLLALLESESRAGSDRDLLVRAACVDALGNHCARLAQQAADPLSRHMRDAAAEQAAQFTAEVVEVLLELCGEERDGRLLQSAALALAKIGSSIRTTASIDTPVAVGQLASLAEAAPDRYARGFFLEALSRVAGMSESESRDHGEGESSLALGRTPGGLVRAEGGGGGGGGGGGRGGGEGFDRGAAEALVAVLQRSRWDELTTSDSPY